jgi:hypothetical protein
MLVHPEYAARNVRGVDGQLNRSGISHIARGRDGIDQGEGLRLGVLRWNELPKGGVSGGQQQDGKRNAVHRVNSLILGWSVPF